MRLARHIGDRCIIFVLAGTQVNNFYRVFPEGFTAVLRRYVDIAYGNSAAAASHLYLLVVLQFLVYFRIGIERKQGPVMSIRQSRNIHLRRRTVRIHTGVQVDIVGTGQFAVYFHAVAAGNIVVYFADQNAFQGVGSGFRRHVHFEFVAAA